MKLCRCYFLCFSLAFSALPARAEPMREFLVSSAYGVLAGSLVGAATLALSEDPDSNYNNIAKGASLGLYAGMLMGAYLVFVVPDPGERRAGFSYPLETETSLGRVALFPIKDGLAMNWELRRF